METSWAKAVDPKKVAAKILNCDEKDVIERGVDRLALRVFSPSSDERMEIAIGDEKRVQNAAEVYVGHILQDYVCYVKPEIVAKHTDFCEEWMVKAIREMQEGGELANKPLLSLVTDTAGLVKDIIKDEGRGLFLATCDEKEGKINVDGIDYFYYRVG